MNTSLHLTVATVVEQDDKFLIVEETAGGQLVLNQPAGHVENGESFAEAAIRETYEETGWHVKPSAILAIYRWDHPKSGETFFRITFTAQALSFDEHATLDDGIMRALWMDKPALQSQQTRLRSPMVLRCIDDFYSQVRYPLDLFLDIQ